MLDWEECVQSLKCAFHKGQYPTGGYEFLWLVRTFLVLGPWCQPDAHTHVLPNSVCSFQVVCLRRVPRATRGPR